MIKRIEKMKQTLLALKKKKTCHNVERGNNSPSGLVQSLGIYADADAENHENDTSDDEDNLDRLAHDLPRKTRGRTELKDIWNLGPGQELSSEFNIYNQCVDNGELEYFCGTVARNRDITPLEFDDWRLFDETEKQPSRSKIYVKYHRHKDGKPVSDEAEENLNKIQAILDNQTANGEPPEESDGLASLDGDALSQVFGPDKNGRVRGIGSGVTPKMFERSNLQALKENEQMKEKK
ncbi:Transposase, Ptta/En/Spm, plant [Corchorus capsularis]|uniref:Transposase, Ptta/En/Spm, plant n=1 Tax=Corchorus capsularis TaxID=210143 RepID=A0A1R3JI99_COCAP|nr:Transposase, Ptta/En/Spm, plant [Corchorus capsularis]